MTPAVPSRFLSLDVLGLKVLVGEGWLPCGFGQIMFSTLGGSFLMQYNGSSGKFFRVFGIISEARLICVHGRMVWEGGASESLK